MLALLCCAAELLESAVPHRWNSLQISSRSSAKSFSNHVPYPYRIDNCMYRLAPLSLMVASVLQAASRMAASAHLVRTEPICTLAIRRDTKSTGGIRNL